MLIVYKRKLKKIESKKQTLVGFNKISIENNIERKTS